VVGSRVAGVPILADQCQARPAVAVTEDIVVGSRVVGVPILAGQCQARPAVAVTEDIVVGNRVVGVPILDGQRQARLVAAVTQAGVTAAGRRELDHAEATQEADRMAALLMEDTITTK